MLAWLHSSAVGEQEALEVLFIAQEGEDGAQKKSILGGFEEGLKSDPTAEDEAFGRDARHGLVLLVDKNLEAVCKPLKVSEMSPEPGIYLTNLIRVGQS